VSHRERIQERAFVSQTRLWQWKLSVSPGLIGAARRTLAQKTFIDVIRTKSKADDRLTPPDTPFRRGQDVLVVRRPGSRPILRISKRKKKRPQQTPPPGVRTMPIERITELPPVRRVFAGGSETFQEASGARATTSPTRASQTAPKPKAIAKVEPEVPVSLHKSILKRIGAGVGRSIDARVQQKFGGAAILPAVGAVGRVLTGRVATAGGIGAAVGSLFGGRGGGGVCPAGEHLNKQDGVGGPAGSYCVKNRRINFGNARAARRSVRRLKGARKLLRDIEKMMPTKTRARRAPAGHQAHLHHTGGS